MEQKEGCTHGQFAELVVSEEDIGRIEVILNEDGSISFRRVAIDVSPGDYMKTLVDDFVRTNETIDKLIEKTDLLSANVPKFRYIRKPKKKKEINLNKLGGFGMVFLAMKLLGVKERTDETAESIDNGTKELYNSKSRTIIVYE